MSADSAPAAGSLSTHRDQSLALRPGNALVARGLQDIAQIANLKPPKEPSPEDMEQTETIYRRLRHYVETKCLRARDLVIEGNLDGAIAEYTKVIEFVPDYAGGYHGRARAYLCKEDFDLAIADYTEAIRLVPRFEEAYWGRGEAYLQKGDHAKAELDFAEAKRLGYKPT